ncbi:MAG TPA: hypothetical protein VN677_06020 [Gemmatimonadaceae bacterium]|jgi:hypothetical protein|nr:hypothetical protein [Gemmatimonadaceae bacterium]
MVARTMVLGWTLVSLMAVAGCASGNQRPTTDASGSKAQTYLTVDNTLPETFQMYVTDGVRKLRMGTAMPLRQTRMLIPSSVIFPAVSLEFLAQPMDNSGPAISERLTINPGENVGLKLAR